MIVIWLNDIDSSCNTSLSLVVLSKPRLDMITQIRHEPIEMKASGKEMTIWRKGEETGDRSREREEEEERREERRQEVEERGKRRRVEERGGGDGGERRWERGGERRRGR